MFECKNCNNYKFLNNRVYPCTECLSSLNDEGILNKPTRWEDKKMDIKINYKAPMTEEEQRNKFLSIINAIEDESRELPFLDHEEYADKAMEICKNEPKVIDYISIDVSNITFASWNGIREIRLTPDQIREIKAIKL